MSNRPTLNLIGAGSIGSVTGLLLALMGRSIAFRLVIYDHDFVEPHNPRNQLYREEDVGTKELPIYKADALEAILKTFSAAEIETRREKVSESTELTGVVVVMVDSMKERKKIFRSARFNAAVPLYIEARSGGTLAVVYALDPRDPDQVEEYEGTLYDDSGASAAPCADPHTLPTLFAIAAVIARLIDESSQNGIRSFVEALINFAKFPIIKSGTKSSEV